MLHSFPVVHFSCCTFFILYSFHVAPFSYGTLFIFCLLFLSLFYISPLTFLNLILIPGAKLDGHKGIWPGFFHVSLFLMYAFLVLHLFPVVLSSCCTFFILYSFHVAPFTYGALFVFVIFFHFSWFFFELSFSLMFDFFLVAFFSCCFFSVLQSFHVFIFLCCTLLVLHFFHISVFSFYTLLMLLFYVLHYFHAAFLLHSFHVALILCYRFAFLFWKWKVQSELPMHYFHFTLLTVNLFSEKVFWIKLWSSRLFQLLCNVETLSNHLLQDSPAFFSNIKTECFSFANMLE